LDRNVPFVDVPATMEVHGAAMERALVEVLRSGQFINGPWVRELEDRLATRLGVDHAVACGSGTAAEQLVLMALGIGPGDEVLVPDFTFIATAEAVCSVGANPVPVDVDPVTFTMDPDAARAALGPAVKAMVPVSIFGQAADFAALEAVAAEAGIHCLEDACQSLGAQRQGRNSGTFGHASFTSFYPSKPLGGIGDGGMIFTRDAALAERLRSLREHGHVGRHRHTQLGINSRLDSLQAAALLVKVAAFDREVELRQAAARRYDEALAEVVTIPRIQADSTSSYAQYTVRLSGPEAREALQDHLEARGVPTALHYPRPVHTQESMRDWMVRVPPTPVAQELCRTVLSLPLSAYIARDDQDRVIEGVLSWAEGGRAAATG